MLSVYTKDNNNITISDIHTTSTSYIFICVQWIYIWTFKHKSSIWQQFWVTQVPCYQTEALFNLERNPVPLSYKL